MLNDIIGKQSLVTCEPDAKVNDVARIMADRNVGAVMVLTGDKPRGIVTDRDIVLRCIAKNVDVSDCTVEQIMSESVETVKMSDGLFDCIKKMHNAHVRRMPVVDDQGKAIGMISFGDIMAILSKEFVTITEADTPLDKHQDKPQLKVA
jgi:signal-transduction protein with cAMP-binding, CBS, and nucleotidyltransferase domain